MIWPFYWLWEPWKVCKMTSSGLWRHKYTTMRSWDELSWFSWGFLGFATMSTWYCRLVRSIKCLVWACLWMSGTLFTILIKISHCAYFTVLKILVVLVAIWPTLPVTWRSWVRILLDPQKIEHFFSSTFFSFLVYIYHVHNKYRVFNKKMWKRDHFLHFLTVA